MSKDYKVMSAVIGFHDLTESIRDEAEKGWDVHTFIVLPSTEDEVARMYALLEKPGEEGHRHSED